MGHVKSGASAIFRSRYMQRQLGQLYHICPASLPLNPKLFTVLITNPKSPYLVLYMTASSAAARCEQSNLLLLNCNSSPNSPSPYYSLQDTHTQLRTDRNTLRI